MFEFDIEDLLKGKFFNIIYDECKDYIDMNSSEIKEYFDEKIDFCELALINNVSLNDYNKKCIQDQVEIIGSAFVFVWVDGYKYISPDYVYISSELMKFRIEFMFYIKNNKPEDFYIIKLV